MADNLFEFHSSGTHLEPFHVLKFGDAKCVWVNPEKMPPQVSNADWGHSYVESTFAYGVPDSLYFPASAFDAGLAKTAHAESYGGLGSAGNGGGARCGILEGVQVKGLGKNCLVGKNADTWYSSGCLQLSEALGEAVFSEIVDRILPYGAVNCYALILTGLELPGKNPKDPSETGALLLREPALRPGHFLRAPYFSPFDLKRPGVLDDSCRVRQCVKRFTELHSEHGDIELALSSFLGLNAEQFAVARLMRLAHGSFAPSNCCFNGQWIDLTLTTAIPTGVNYKLGGQGVPAFYQEAFFLREMLGELLYTFNKYSGRELDINAYMQFYGQHYSDSIYFYACGFFGFPEDILKDKEYSADYRVLVEALDLLIGFGDDYYASDCFPACRNQPDVIIDWMRYILGIDEEILRYRAEPRIEKSRAAYLRLIGNLAYSNYTVATDRSSLETALAIKMFRKEYLREFLFRRNLERSFLALSLERKDNYQEDVRRCMEFVDWAFNKDEVDEITVFDTSNSRLVFCKSLGLFDFQCNGVSHASLHASDLKSMLVRNGEGIETMVGSYDIADYIQAVVEIISSISASHETPARLHSPQVS